MCGIVYIKRFDGQPAQKQVLKRYGKQQTRGSEGFGYIGVKPNGIVSSLVRVQFEHEIRVKLQASNLSEVLFHHRYPTSTPNIPEAAHPIFVGHKELQYSYYVVHNGIINNEEDLKLAHDKLGYTYNTLIKTQYRTKKGHVYTSDEVFNDSESLAIELARTIEGLQPECNAKGSIAYIAYQVEKISGKVVATYFGTNGGNPLVINVSKDSIAIASEGHGTNVEAMKAYRIDAATNEILECNIKLQPTYSKTTYPYSLPDRREIDDTFDRYPRMSRDEDKGLAQLEGELESIDDELIGLQGDILFSKNEEDFESLSQYSQDYANLLTRRTKLEKIYAQKAITA